MSIHVRQTHDLLGLHEGIVLGSKKLMCDVIPEAAEQEQLIRFLR